jgi:hypothetical protein
MTACAVGRRPAGLGEPLHFEGCAIGGYFADVARLEAASVTAFRILRDELRVHEAPKKLVRAAARAACDEIRHTRATGALARRFGAHPRPSEVLFAQSSQWPLKTRSKAACACDRRNPSLLGPLSRRGSACAMPAAKWNSGSIPGLCARIRGLRAHFERPGPAGSHEVVETDPSEGSTESNVSRRPTMHAARACRSRLARGKTSRA